MSTTIEGKQSIQVNVPESSTVIIIPKGRKEEASHEVSRLLSSERLKISRLIPPIVLRRVAQEIIERGLDADIDRGTTDLMLAMANARRNGVSHGLFEKFLDESLKSMQRQTSESQPRLEEAREHILETAELIWTAKSEQEVNEILQAQTVPFPQKLQ